MPLSNKALKRIRSFDLPVSYRVGDEAKLKDALNVCSNQGRLDTRFGRSLYNTTLLGGPVISQTYFKTATGLRYLLAKVGTTLYSVASTGAHVIIKTGLSATTKHRGYTWARGSTSRHILAIGEDGLFQWDGTTFTQLGQNPPVGHTVSLVAGSLINGTYRVHLTFYSSTTGLETNSSHSANVTTASQNIVVDNIPVTAPNATIDKVRIYLKNMATVDGPLLVTEVNLGVVGYTIASRPESVVIPPLANSAPMLGGGKFLTEFNGMLVYAGNNTFKNDVFFSEQDLPDAFNDGTAPNRLVHYAKGNGEITGLATGLYNNSVLDPYLVIFKRRSIEINSGIAGEERSIQISAQIGCVSHDTIQVKNGDVYFLSDHGWRVISNGRLVTDQANNTVTLGAGDIDDIFTQPGFSFEVNKSQAINAFSVYYSTLDQYITWVCEGASLDFDKTYSYEFKVGGFKPYKFNTPSTAACVGEDPSGDEVVFMGDANGAIYTHSVKENKGADHNSAGIPQPIEVFALLPWIEGDDNDASYNWREIILKRVAGSGNMEVKVWVNYSLDSMTASHVIESLDSGFILDLSKLDQVSMKEAGRTIEKARADINQVGQNILIGFYQYSMGSSLGLVSIQIESNKNGNKN